MDRYNLALAPGPAASRRGACTLRAKAPELLRVRKVLRWLKFCRLVAEVRRVGEDWTAGGGGARRHAVAAEEVRAAARHFLSVVPVLKHWELTATLGEPAPRATLVLDDKDPWCRPIRRALGHIPEEVAALAEGFEDADWELDLAPLPRHMGAAGLCVPDLTFRHRADGARGGAGALPRVARGPARAPARGAALASGRGAAAGRGSRAGEGPRSEQALEAHPQVVLFNGFPSAKRLRERLERLGSPRTSTAS